MRIYKYPVEMKDEISISIPVGAEILCVQTQYETPCIWALVDPEAREEVRTFYLRGTGHQIDRKPGDRYIGTFQLGGGGFIGHLFEFTDNRG